MKLSYIIIIIILIIIGLIIGFNYYVKHARIGPGLPPGLHEVSCNWVFKTKGDYSNLISVTLSQDKTEVGVYPLFGELRGLNQDYYTSIWACSYSNRLNVAFTSLTWDEWRHSYDDCEQQMRDKIDQLRIEKCGSLDFDIFEARIDERKTEPESVIPGIENPTKCIYNITLEESKWANSCEPIISASNLLNNVIDDDPFIELYLCQVPFDKLNSIIDNGELGNRCEKQI